MPICTSCTKPTAYLYTVYESAYNLRLEQCDACHSFADPYVEHDTLTLLLDLILLKRDVYRHLLFNRGLGARTVGRAELARTDDASQPDASHAERPLDASKPAESDGARERARENARWWLVVQLGTGLVLVDAFIRWTHMSSRIAASDQVDDILELKLEVVAGFLRISIGCLVETIAFHAGVMLACLVLTKSPRPSKVPCSSVSGIHQEFRYSHVPLTLLYSSLTKLLLLLLLSIWRPAPVQQPAHRGSLECTSLGQQALSLLDEDRFDREWVVRNVLGGMSAGFGLRVVLDCHPILTTTIILVGWVVKTLVAGMISQWVGIGFGPYEVAGEMWLAYSIP